MQDIAAQEDATELPELSDMEDLSDTGELPDLGADELTDMGELEELQETDPGLTDAQTDGLGNLDRAIEELESIAPEAMAKTSAKRETEGREKASPSDVIWDIPVEISIIIGSAELSVAELMALEGGEIISLDRRVGEPVDVVVNGRRIAKGEITVMDDDETRFGIKITEIVNR